MRFTMGEDWWQYSGTADYALGTSLMYRRDWWSAHRFDSVQVGEDNRFASEASAARELASTDARELMYATIHPGNTSPRNFGSSWKKL